MAMSNPRGDFQGGGIPGVSGRWLTITAIAFIVLGIVAMAMPWVAGLAVAFLVGWLLVFGGIVHVVEAFGSGGTGRTIWQALLGALYFIGGIYFLTHPLIGLGSLTLLLAAVLVAEAVLEFVAYVRGRNEGASVWLLANCIITLLLGVLIWVNWPSSAAWAIGTLVGVNMLMTGISRLMLGAVVRSLARRATA